MNGKKLHHTEEEKDLGVLIDEKLDFLRQAAAAIEKANNKVMGLTKRTFSVLDKTTLPLLFTSFVRTHLEYGNIVFLQGEIIPMEGFNVG